MFNDAPTHLNDAAIAGQKTMTRRMVPDTHIKAYNKYLKKHPGSALSLPQFLIKNGYARFVVGEVVALAESYKSLKLSPNLTHVPKNGTEPVKISKLPGWNNKMYAAAVFMRHHIRITSVSVERLQDITDEDIKREGVFLIGTDEVLGLDLYGTSRKTREALGYSLRHAFATLINKIGTGRTWEKNPLVYVYGFELID